MPPGIGSAGGGFEVFKRRSPDSRLNLSSNELLHPRIGEVLRQALTEVDPELLRRYPVGAGAIAAIADFFGIPEDEFLVTPGSDSALRLVCAHYAASSGDNGQILLQYPNYDVWENVSALHRLPLERVGGGPDDQAARLLARARATNGALVVVSVPNGPGGWVFSGAQLDELTRVAAERDHLLVIDSCYQAFDGPIGAQLARRGGPVLVVQTLSKSHGLAGARVGLLAGAPGRIHELARTQLEQTVSGVTLQVVRAMLDRADVLEEIWADIRSARSLAERRLRERGLEPLPSGGNFLTVPLGTAQRAAATERALSTAGYRVKNLSAITGMAGCLRFTVGDQDTTESAVRALLAGLSTVGEPDDAVTAP
ncbi:aminotransferase class I/II-fold pyridoxal phosphate-dependent enzyme [Micromonospora sp. NPDC047074]|uniref:aminotransferase class I/II-fold pyridoxal phosphate-dependent enzyme n=1 Tax=Micromonospora sp. NPDC047074 TaxID=3154339 RepID=UPI0033F9678E